jgi:uncharacterized protein (TIGR02647 family)
MSCTPDLVEELNILMRFNLESSRLGIKVHKDADPSVIAATGRLHAKGLITQVDGGYLTSLGHEAAEHAAMLLGILTSRSGRQPAL